MKFDSPFFTEKSKYKLENGKKQYISATTIYNYNDGKKINFKTKNYIKSMDGTHTFEIPKGINPLSFIDGNTDILYITKTVTSVGKTTTFVSESKINYSDKTFDSDVLSPETNTYQSFNYNDSSNTNSEMEDIIDTEENYYNDYKNSTNTFEDTKDFSINYDSLNNSENSLDQDLNSNYETYDDRDYIPKSNNYYDDYSYDNYSYESLGNTNNYNYSYDDNYSLNENEMKSFSDMASNFGIPKESFNKLKKETINKFEELNNKYKECLRKLNHLIITFREKDFIGFEYDENRIRTENETEIVQIKYDFRDWVENNINFKNEDLLNYIKQCIIRVNKCINDLINIEIKLREFITFSNSKSQLKQFNKNKKRRWFSKRK